MANARPTFLTVLCILTFIASAWGIYSGISTYLTADSAMGIAQSAIEDAKDKIESADSGTEAVEGIMDSISNSLSPAKMKQNALGGIAGTILCALGAFLMWNLNKKGFWVYVAGTIVGVAAPILAYGGFVGLTAGGFGALIGILFCVLYGLNLKHMS